MFDLSLIARVAEQIASDPLYTYEHAQPGQGGMSPAQREVHASQHDRRLAIGGNQIGTRSGFAGLDCVRRPSSWLAEHIAQNARDRAAWCA